MVPRSKNKTLSQTKSSRIRLVLLFLLTYLGFQQSILAQNDSLLLKDITKISITRQGQILACDNKSNIFLLDSTGKIWQQFSPKRPATIHLLEGWNGLRPFAFYRDFQEFVLLDRFLLSDGPTAIDPEKTGYARLAAPAMDGNLWVLDEAGFILKKVDISNQKTLFSTPLDLILKAREYEISYIKEYHNQLYLCDKKGPVLQFDQMGNFKKRLPLKETGWIGFANEEIYSVSADSIRYFHPYKLSMRTVALPKGIQAKDQLIFQGNAIWWISDRGLNRRKL